jgi:hypothetical protein
MGHLLASAGSVSNGGRGCSGTSAARAAWRPRARRAVARAAARREPALWHIQCPAVAAAGPACVRAKRARRTCRWLGATSACRACQPLLLHVHGVIQVLDARLTAAHELSSGRAADLDVEHGFRVPASAPCLILNLQGRQPVGCCVANLQTRAPLSSADHRSPKAEMHAFQPCFCNHRVLNLVTSREHLGTNVEPFRTSGASARAPWPSARSRAPARRPARRSGWCARLTRSSKKPSSSRCSTPVRGARGGAAAGAARACGRPRRHLVMHDAYSFAAAALVVRTAPHARPPGCAAAARASCSAC